MQWAAQQSSAGGGRCERHRCMQLSAAPACVLPRYGKGKVKAVSTVHLGPVGGAAWR